MTIFCNRIRRWHLMRSEMRWTKPFVFVEDSRESSGLFKVCLSFCHRRRRRLPALLCVLCHGRGSCATRHAPDKGTSQYIQRLVGRMSLEPKCCLCPASEPLPCRLTKPPSEPNDHSDWYCLLNNGRQRARQCSRGGRPGLLFSDKRPPD